MYLSINALALEVACFSRHTWLSACLNDAAGHGNHQTHPVMMHDSGNNASSCGVACYADLHACEARRFDCSSQGHGIRHSVAAHECGWVPHLSQALIYLDLMPNHNNQLQAQSCTVTGHVPFFLRAVVIAWASAGLHCPYAMVCAFTLLRCADSGAQAT
jgi:hypothetical protein